MRCLVCVAVVLTVAAAAPAPEGYGAPPPLTPAEEEEAALEEFEAANEGPGPLSFRPFGTGIRGREGFIGGYNGRLSGRDGRLGGRLGRPLGSRSGLYDRPPVGPLGNRLGPGRLPGNRFINQGNPPNLRPDGFVDGPSRPYSFDYEVVEPEFDNDYGHAEESDGVVTQGEYHVLLPDGRTQIVTYTVEGDSGFQAVVRYEGEAQFPDPGSLGGLGRPVAFGGLGGLGRPGRLGGLGGLGRPGRVGGLGGLGRPGRVGGLGGLGGPGRLGGLDGLGRPGRLGGPGGPGDVTPGDLGSQTYGAPLA